MKELLPPDFQDDLRGLSQMAGALWGDPEAADLAVLESYSALMTVNPDSERRGIRLAGILLLRADREGTRAAGLKVQDPFYRLEAESRLVLMGLHRSQWSYPRLSQVLNVSAERIQEIAWSSRVRLAYSPEQVSKVMIHPTGSPLTGSRCPDYHPGRPWTQRYLDGDSTPQEKLFLETHLRSCASCLKVIERARELYYRAEAWVPRLEKEASMRFDRVLDFARTLEIRRNPLSQGLLAGFGAASLSVIRGLNRYHWLALFGILGIYVWLLN
jgi:hypothetical protein